MLYFIVSGYIPGTEIQITFEMYLVFLVSFVGCLMLYTAIRSIVKALLRTKREQRAIRLQIIEEIAL